MPDFTFLDDNEPDDGLPKIRAAAPRRPPHAGKPTGPIADQIDDLAKGLNGFGKQLTGCGCLMVILAILLSLPFLLAVL